MRLTVLKLLVTGIRRQWKAGLTQALSLVGVIWLLTEISTKIFAAAASWLSQHGNLYISLVIAAAAIRFASFVYEARSVSFFIPTTDFQINIRFGNLLEAKTHWLIGVNEFFDSDIGHIVSQDSLHGKFITSVYNGDAARFRAALDSALAGISATQTQRQNNASLKYEIGTTAVLPNGPHKAFLVAVSQTDLVTAKASSTVPLLWDALRGGLQSVHDYGNGLPLSMPLIGNGRSSVNIEPQHLLRLIVLALVDFGRKVGLPKQVNIIVSEACFEMLDIREIRRDWSKK